MLPSLRQTTIAFLAVLTLGLGNALAQSAPDKLPAEVHTYKTVAGRNLQLWVAKPTGWKASDQRPAVVFFHGGGWISGDASRFAPQCHHLASLGLVAITVQYRFWDRKADPVPAVCVHDARSAFKWVADHAAELGIDPRRIAAAGGSAGGHLAACLVLDHSYNDPAEATAAVPAPSALILFNPAVNLVGLGGTTDANRSSRQHLSPSFHLTANHPPTLLMVGEKDTTTPVDLDRTYIADLTRLGVRAELKTYPGQTHGFFNYKPAGNPWYEATLADMDKFLTSLGWIKAAPAS